MVEEALSTKGRATNVTDVVVKDKAGNIIYEGLDK
jgi:hypothetical protein